MHVLPGCYKTSRSAPFLLSLVGAVIQPKQNQRFPSKCLVELRSHYSFFEEKHESMVAGPGSGSCLFITLNQVRLGYNWLGSPACLGHPSYKYKGK